MVDSPALLITDDDRAVRETLESLFAPRGYRTFLAASGDEAMRIVGRESVHIALLDMHMPRLSGLETILQVKRLGFPLPCILMSAALDDSIRLAAAKANVFSVLAKPLSCQQVVGEVERALAQSFDWPKE